MAQLYGGLGLIGIGVYSMYSSYTDGVYDWVVEKNKQTHSLVGEGKHTDKTYDISDGVAYIYKNMYELAMHRGKVLFYIGLILFIIGIILVVAYLFLPDNQISSH